MLIGVPKEIKNNEYRVGATPSGVWAFCRHGHQVLVERGAGLGSGFPDEAYVSMGAEVLDEASEVWRRADMVIKVKEPLPSEYPLLQEGKVLFTYLHLAADRALTEALLDSGTIGIAYETVEVDGALPLLTPMSEVAGRMAPLVGACSLLYPNGGLGRLMSGVPGVAPAEVLILGGGIVGLNAAKVAAGIGARVTLLEVSPRRLAYLDDVLPANCSAVYSDRGNLEHYLPTADLVIGGVLLHGAKAPHLITRDMLHDMKPRAVIVDVSVDQGGCVETTRPTTHESPTYYEEGILHYCVANMPGAVPQTSTSALTSVTLPYALRLADQGVEAALRADPGLALGVNVWLGRLTCGGVAEAFGMACSTMEAAVA